MYQALFFPSRAKEARKKREKKITPDLRLNFDLQTELPFAKCSLVLPGLSTDALVFRSMLVITSALREIA